MAVAKLEAVWPEGNEYRVPSGRVRCTENLMPCVTSWVTICARTRSDPTAATRGLPDACPTTWTAMAPAICTAAPPMVSPGPSAEPIDDDREKVLVTRVV